MADSPSIPSPLSPERLCRHCDAEAFSFETTDELEPLDGNLGQDRALEAIRFAAEIKKEGYNLFVHGMPGVGRHTTVARLFAESAEKEPPPSDWVYVYNFKTPHRPRALSLPAGTGRVLAREMENLVEDLRVAIPAAFESDDYRNRLQAIEDEFRERQEDAFEGLSQEAKEHDIALVRTPTGFALAPTKNGEPVKPEVFEKLPKAEQEQIEAAIEDLQEKLQAILREIPKWEKERREAIRALHKEITGYSVGHRIQELRNKFSNSAKVIEYIEFVESDLLENIQTILVQEHQARNQGGTPTDATPGPVMDGFRRYQVNPIIDNAEASHAPSVYEDHPTLANLVGRVEHVAQMGALMTDFTMIRPGALHRANGGYLLLDARKVLSEPLAWDALKRALMASHIKIESASERFSLVHTRSLEPEPIPLDIKIALCGEPRIYHLLSQLDPEFPRLFKVEADFDWVVGRDSETNHAYARLIAGLVRDYDLRAFDRHAVARVVERNARIAEDSEKLSLRLEKLADLLRESDHFAAKAGAERVALDHVDAAIHAEIRRSNKLQEKIQESIERGTILVEVDGARSGQINGLSVYQVGGYAFGKPTRITARTWMGAGKVVDIEREVELGGPIHSKGVLILSGFLGERYGTHVPLSLHASLVFEQSYGGVEGDSASSAELYALLSALAEAPIRQDLAVTGSVNQHGQVQAIGGVNEKIEGFFELCQAKGLTGKQGVLIPEANVKHLMLRAPVVDAAERGDFHIYPIATIDQGIALLTGIEAGERDAEGRYPEDSVNGRVEARLRRFAETRARFAKDGGDAGGSVT